MHKIFVSWLTRFALFCAGHCLPVTLRQTTNHLSHRPDSEKVPIFHSKSRKSEWQWIQWMSCSIRNIKPLACLCQRSVKAVQVVSCVDTGTSHPRCSHTDTFGARSVAVSLSRLTRLKQVAHDNKTWETKVSVALVFFFDMFFLRPSTSESHELQGKPQNFIWMQ